LGGEIQPNWSLWGHGGTNFTKKKNRHGKANILGGGLTSLKGRRGGQPRGGVGETGKFIFCKVHCVLWRKIGAEQEREKKREKSEAKLQKMIYSLTEPSEEQEANKANFCAEGNEGAPQWEKSILPISKGPGMIDLYQVLKQRRA